LVKHGRRISARGVREAAGRTFRLLLVGADDTDRAALTRVFIPDHVSTSARAAALGFIDSTTTNDDWRQRARLADVVVFTPQAIQVIGESPGRGISIDPYRPEIGVEELLRRWPEYRLALGRAFPWMRDTIALHLMRAMARRNASVAALSALPEVVPTPLTFLWALGGFASDSVVLTANQIRLAFELAALYGEKSGWAAQRAQVLTIVAGAFGWRALARAAVGAVPGGAGLAAKTAIAYSASLGVGRALWSWQKRHSASELDSTKKFQQPVLAGVPANDAIEIGNRTDFLRSANEASATHQRS
jgi:uncharacterized protein (DUF697 family)